MTNLSARQLVMLMCIAEILSMTGFATYPVLLTTLRDVWKMSATEAGFIGGAFFGGYMFAVPLLSALTDRIDARKVYFAATILGALGTLCFGLFATNVVEAAFFQCLTGAGLAGTYMPGLKALTDRIGGAIQSRYIAFYTSAFGIGTSFSFLLSDIAVSAVGWQMTFSLCALGPPLAGLLVIAGLAPLPRKLEKDVRWLDPRPVLRDVSVLGYILGYAAHCWELFGLRAWMVAFLGFVWLRSAGSEPSVTPATIAALVNLVGIPASVLGNEFADRVGRKRFIIAVMVASTALAWITGLSTYLAWWATCITLTFYFAAVMGDSAALTAGLVSISEPTKRGAIFAVYSFLGFGAGFAAPLIFGVILDHTGGKSNPLAWTIAMGSLGLGGLLAPLALKFHQRRTTTTSGASL